MFANFRDVGGLPLVGGGRTRDGVLYRGDAPYADGVAPELEGWPPSLVVDLRSGTEAEHRSFAWPPSTLSLHHPLHDDLAVMALEPDADLTALYTSILDRYSDRVTAPLAHAVRADGPILVHCSVGKDRTGIVVAALLLAAGVEPSAVRKDYALTNERVGAIKERMAPDLAKYGVKIDASWWQAPAEAIGVVLDRLTGWPGGARSWWLDHGADERDLAAWSEMIRD